MLSASHRDTATGLANEDTAIARSRIHPDKW